MAELWAQRYSFAIGLSPPLFQPDQEGPPAGSGICSQIETGKAGAAAPDFSCQSSRSGSDRLLTFRTGVGRLVVSESPISNTKIGEPHGVFYS